MRYKTRSSKDTVIKQVTLKLEKNFVVTTHALWYFKSQSKF